MTEPAPLVSIPEAPVPDHGTAEWFVGADGATLRAACFFPGGQASTEGPRGSVIVSPGRSEPIEKYYEVVSDLLARGFVVLVHDWRGQGLSVRALPDRLSPRCPGNISGNRVMILTVSFAGSGFISRLYQKTIYFQGDILKTGVLLLTF